jgi:hypothetical protein
MTARNDITKDKIITKPANDHFRDGWDRIFGKGILDSEIENEEKLPTLSVGALRKKQAS